MATEMKLLVALLLLVCVCTVHGERGAKKKDVCTQGMVAMEVFFEYRGCRGPRPRHIVRELMDSMQDNFTVDSLDYMFTNYCSTVLPRVVQCFEKNIGNCSAQQQNSLKTVAQQTGFLCQPNSTRVSPVITHMLTQLSDADLSDNPECNTDIMWDIHSLCNNRSMEAIGMAHGNWSILHDLTMEQMVPKVQTFSRTMLNCTVTHIRDQPNRCPQWRGVALMAARFVFFPLLGNRMTFTNEDIDRMFGWDSATQTSE